MTEVLPAFPPKKKGWPKGKSRGPRVHKEEDPVRGNGPKGHTWKNADYSGFLADNGDLGALHIPKELFPDGVDLLWATDSIRGMPFPEERASAEKRYWESVQVGDFDGRFDHFMPRGHVGEIIVGDAVLCCRPLELSIMGRKKDQEAANQQVRIKEAQIRGGDVPGVAFDTNHPSARRANKLNKSYERIDVPSDNE